MLVVIFVHFVAPQGGVLIYFHYLVAIEYFRFRIVRVRQLWLRIGPV